MVEFDTDIDPGDENDASEAPEAPRAYGPGRPADHAVYLNGQPYELGGSPVVTNAGTAALFAAYRNAHPRYRAMGVWSFGKVS